MTFHISIGVGDSTIDAISSDMPLDWFLSQIDQEARMVKSAILYADKVTLYSMLSWPFLLAYAQKDFIQRLPKARKRFAVEGVNVLGLKDGELTQTGLGVNLPEDVRLAQEAMSFLLREVPFASEFSDQFSMVEAYDVLRDALKSGLLDVRILGGLGTIRYLAQSWEALQLNSIQANDIASLMERVADERGKTTDLLPRQFAESVVEEYSFALAEAIVQGETYALFDRSTIALLKERFTSETLDWSDSKQRMGKHVSLAAELLSRLPMFDRATVGELIDIRKELRKPLVRFRSAISEFAGQIETADWNKDMEVDAERIFLEKVSPAILDIEDAVKSNSLLGNLAYGLGTRSLLPPGGSAIGVTLSTFTGVPSIISAGLGLAAGTAAMLTGVFREWAKSNMTIQQNRLFFYYEAQKRLSRRKQSRKRRAS